ncbi:MAG: division/cell wall cluster transcriptional repressor MraZ [Nitrospirota bacterium]
MSVSRGIHNQKLDAKGRLALPARFREALAARDQNKLVVTGWTECLWVYSLEEWLRVEEQIDLLPSQEPEVMLFVRLFVGTATEVELDAQGRFLISQPLREYAGLDKEVMVVGLTKRIEVWDKERWLAQQPKTPADYAALNKSIAGFGLRL